MSRTRVTVTWEALGSLLLAFGLWGLSDRQSLSTALGSPLYGLRVCSFAALGAGAVTVLLSGLGGAVGLGGARLSPTLPPPLPPKYFGLLLLLLAGQVTAGIIAYTQRDTLATKVAASVRELIRGYPAQGPPGDPHENWDAVQQQLGCCGWTGPQDWTHPEGSPEGGPPALPHGRCPTAAPQDVFPRGCAESIRGWVAENLITVVGAGVGIGLVELFLLLLSMFLVRNLDPDYEKLLRGL
ncbi:leukocyte antigen CD37 [Aegotheles albertisi]